jgi:hypothetical protein
LLDVVRSAARSYWLAVTPAAFASTALAEGFAQFGRGYPQPAQMLQPGDGIILVARPPRESSQQHATAVAIGEVALGDAYVAVVPGREIWRRDVHWWPCEALPLHAGNSAIEPPITLRMTAGNRARIPPQAFFRMAGLMCLTVPAFRIGASADAAPTPGT